VVVDGGAVAVAFLLGRLAFGGLLAFQGLNHFMDLETMAGYAEMKGIPAPTAAVVASGLILVGGGLGIGLGVFPLVAAAVLVVFFVVATPTMHDFWAAPDDQAENEMIHFIKNVELLGASLVFLALATESWPYAIGIGL
jgi:uncharacterized membrane protein YphA (DoxX/SURF4 family)